MRRLFERMGIDFDQWRALLRVSIKNDLRVAGAASTLKGNSKSRYGALLPLLIFYMVTGVFFAAIILFNKDVFLTATVFLTYAMFMIAALVLIEYHAVVISPDDYAILGYQPISSRTYFAAKLANALFYTAVLTTALALVPIGAYWFTLGFNPVLGTAAAAATYLSTITATLAMVFLYAALLRIVHPRKLSRALSYLQLVLALLIYGGYAVVPELVDKESLAVMSLEKTPLLMLHPATWFASYLELAVGHWGAAEVVASVGSIVVLGLLIGMAGRKLSLEYSEQLAAMTSRSEGRKAAALSSPKKSIFFKKQEGRAVALLIRNQFKYDQKFRLAVLGILPLTVFYLLLGLREGPIRDPFINPEVSFGSTALLYFAILLFPVMLKITLVNSDAYQASWIYHATPANKPRLVLAMKDFVMVYFVLPYMALIGAAFVFFFESILHVVLHLVVLLLIAHILLQFSVWVNPELPFSRPVRKGERSGRMILLMVIASFIGMFGLPILFSLVYPRPAVLGATVLGLVGLTLFLERTVEARVSRVTERLQFEG